jgi:hypothetical protein
MVNMAQESKFDINDIYPSKTGLYQYHMENLANLKLKNIIDQVKDRNRMCLTSIQFLTDCYKKIINNNMYEVIYDMLKSDYHYDKNIICLAAIYKRRTDIMDILKDNNFDFNQMVHPNHLLVEAYNYNFLSFAIRYSTLTIIKKLIECGADLMANNQLALKEICVQSKDEIFDYLLDLEIEYKYLCDIFIICCSENNTSRLQKILLKGININHVSKILDCEIGGYNVKTVVFLLDNNYVINMNNDKILYDASIKSNYGMIDFLLKTGLKPDYKTIEYVYMKMDVKIIEIFIKYQIDLAQLKPINNNDHLINKILECGMDKYVLITYLFASISPDARGIDNVFHHIKRIG